MPTRRAAVAAIVAAATTIVTDSGLASRRGWTIEPFATSPFPYDGPVPGTGAPFLDTTKNGLPAHTSPRGGVYPAAPTYADSGVLLATVPRFDPAHSVIIVYLHGNLARLERDVVHRQRVVAQVAASGLDAALVSPQFAVDALDSSAGRFWEPGGFARFLDEASDKLGTLSGAPPQVLRRRPVILVAYSGGYNPAASILARGGAGDRIAGVVLLDALYGEEDAFTTWIARSAGSAFFFSAYSPSTANGNARVEAALTAEGMTVRQGLPPRLEPGTIAFLAAGNVNHIDFVTQAWTGDPLKTVLSRVAL